MSTYLKDFFPKPLLEDILKGECLPFIGSGFSLNANLPDGYSMPQWDDLGKKFASYLPSDYTYTTALEAISAYCHEFTRNSLIGKLSEFLNIDNITPGSAHKAFASLPFKIVCTTNFDFLLEKSYTICKPIVEEPQLSISIDESTTIILKIHGDLNHPSQLVAVEDDYDMFLDKNPLLATYLSYLMIVKTPLFIGYSIDDPDFRQIFKIVNERLGATRRPAYTIKLNANQHEISKFERRGVKVINIIKSGGIYKEVFTDIFNELNDYLNNNFLKTSTFTQNNTRSELLNLASSQNRICFFSIPFKFLAFYKEHIFPIIEQHGFIPVSADEVISYGDTLLAKISAMINKAELIICDISDQNNNVLYELELALKLKDKKILLLTDNNYNDSNINYMSQNLTIIHRTELVDYIEQINNWLDSFSSAFFEEYYKEPKRLFDKKEYRASIISAFSVLEIELNKFDNSQKYAMFQNRSIKTFRLIDGLREIELLNNEEMSKLKQWQQIRNTLVHSDSTVSKDKAKEIIFGIYKIIEKIKDRREGDNHLTTAST